MDQTRTDDSETLAVFGRWYDAHESGDLDGLAGVLASDVAIHSLFKSAPVRGRDDAVAHFVGVTSTFSDMAMALAHRPAATDGRVLVEVEFSGAFTGELTWNRVAHSGAGQPFRVPGAAVIRIGTGRVQSVRTLFDRDDWLRQIGIGRGTGVRRDEDGARSDLEGVP